MEMDRGRHGRYGHLQFWPYRQWSEPQCSRLVRNRTLSDGVGKRDLLFLWALFSFRHLKAQLQRTLLGNLCVVLYCVALGFEIAGAPYGSQQTGAIRIQIALIFPAVALVLAVLAFRGIRRDLRLLRSADRIR